MEPDSSGLLDCSIGVLAKTPIPGRVKTRLHSIWSPETCARFQAACIRDTLTMVKRFAVSVPFLIVDPIEEGTVFSRSLTFPVSLHAQCSGDLGCRMAGAFELLFRIANAEKALLVGTDSPDLPDEIWLEAAASLDTHDVVLSPTVDGGFCLIGLRRDVWLAQRTVTHLFDDVPWSSAETFVRQRERARSMELKVAVSAGWMDVDDAEDVGLLRARLADPSAAARVPEVARFLAETR